MNILFRNEHFVIVEKSAGVLCVPARTGAKDPRPVLGWQLQEELGQQIFPVHRLDFEVRGVVLFALNPKAQSSANSWFEKKMAVKTYLGLSAPRPTPGPELKTAEGEIWECLLLRGKKRAYESPFGKKSLTHARVLGETPAGRLMWELQPITGRSHQLRYEMFRHGWPLVGDKLYGSDQEWSPQCIALEAVRLELPLQAQVQFGLLQGYSLESKLSCQD